MDIQKLTIGQMAQLNYVTTQTLRHYDKLDLFSPYFTDPDTGYRYYHINQSARLDMIQYLQSHGIPLLEIKKHLDSDQGNFTDLLKSQLDFIDEEMTRLSQSKRSITRFINNYEKYTNMSFDGTPFFEYINKRRIFLHKTGINFFEQDDTGYELMLRELKESVISNDLPVSYFYNIGTLVRKEHLIKDKLYSDEVFFFVEDDYKGPGVVEEVPANLYMCICLQDVDKEPEYAKKLMNTLHDEGYEILGDYICEVVLEYPGHADAPRSMYYKIQIPVRNS